MQCNARSKRSGAQCKKDAVVGREQCHIHGGKSLEGPSLPQFRTGRHSKYLPERLASRAEAAAKDAQLLELAQEVGLVDTLISDALSQIDTEESGELFRQIRKGWQSYLEAASTQRREQAQSSLDALIDRGAQSTDARDDAVKLIEQRRKLVDSERKRLVDAQQMVTAQQATTLIAAVVASVRRHADRETCAAISADISGLMVADGGRTVGGTVSARD